MYRCTHTQSAYSDVATNTTAIFCMIGVHVPAVLCFIFQAHLGWERNQVKLYKNLTVRMQPVAIALNYREINGQSVRSQHTGCGM